MNSRVLMITAALLFPSAAFALTPGQAYLKATRFLRTQGAAGFSSQEAQPVLLGEAIAGDPFAAGPRSATLLASLELGSVDARARRVRVLGSLGLASSADTTALLSMRMPSSGFGANRDSLPSSLDTALAIQALDAAGLGGSTEASQATDDLVTRQLAGSGLWPLLRSPAVGVAATGDLATTAQAVLALKPRQGAKAAWTTAYTNATTALTNAAVPARISDRALRLLALLEANPSTQGSALQGLADLQNADGSFGTETLATDRIYATALAARAIKRAGELSQFPFDSDGDGIADGPDPDSDDDGVCDPGETGPTARAPTPSRPIPPSGPTSTRTGSATTPILTSTATASPTPPTPTTTTTASSTSTSCSLASTRSGPTRTATPSAMASSSRRAVTR